MPSNDENFSRVHEPDAAAQVPFSYDLAEPVEAADAEDLRIGLWPWSVLRDRLVNVTDEGLDWIRDSIRQLGRHVRGHGSNVRSRFWSEKNRMIVPCESRTVERPLFTSMEIDRAVAWYLAQLQPLDLTGVDARGRTLPITKTFDALVGLVSGEVFVAEFRSEEQLRAQLRDQPHLYRQEGDVVRYTPYGEMAERFGIPDRVLTPANLPKMAITNWELLKGYSRRRVSEADFQRVREAVRDRPATVVEVAQQAEVPVDVVLAAIARGVVFVDVNRQLVVETETTLVHASFATFVAYTDAPRGAATGVRVIAGLRDGTVASWDSDPVELVHVGQTRVVVRWEGSGRIVEVPIADFERFVQDGTVGLPTTDLSADPVAEALARSNQRERDVATDRASVIRLVLDGQLSKEQAAEALGVKSPRTIERHMRDYRQLGWAGCVPNWRARGNRKRRISVGRLVGMDAAIATYYVGKNGFAKPKRTMEAAYKMYRENSPDPVSLATFKRRIRELAGLEQTRHRDGDRAANRFRTARGRDPFVDLYPLHVIQVDATLGDIFLTLLESVLGHDAFLVRPQVSIAVDVFSQCVVGLYVSLGGESAATALMLLRDVVRRHGRMADIVLMDNGAGYRSKDVQNFVVGICGRELQHRAPHRPQIGGICERLFETMRAELLVSMAGQTSRLKAVREVTKSMDPRRDAAWTLAAFTGILEHFFFEIYNRRVHPGVDMAPLEKLEQGYLLRGYREQQRVAFDANLLAATSPSCGTRQIDPKLGVWVDYRRFRNAEVSKRFHGRDDRTVEVRREPDDCTLVRVLADRQWEEFTSDDRPLLQSYSAADQVAISKAYRAVKASVRRERGRKGFGLGAFLTRIHEAQEAVLKERRSAERRRASDAGSGRTVRRPDKARKGAGTGLSLDFLDRDAKHFGEDG